jgi:PEP-CTERM motif
VRPLWIAFATVFASLASMTAEAGYVITQNLPTNDVIIGVDGRADGGAGYEGPGQNDWYQPFNTAGNLLEYTFQPGTYTFRVIDSTDASAMFPKLTSTQLGEIGDGAWTYNTPWVTQYIAWDVSALNNPQEHQLFTGSVDSTATYYGSAGAAYQAAITGGYFDTIVTGSGRYTGTVQSSYTFTQAETLIFAVPDYYLPDNGGIVGVLITSQSVPEPTSLALLGVGCGGLFVYSRRRRMGGRA